MKDSELYGRENKVLHIISASQRTKQQKIHLDNRSLYLIMVPAGHRGEWVTPTPKPCLVPHTHEPALPPHPPVARRKLELQHWDTGNAELQAGVLAVAPSSQGN